MDYRSKKPIFAHKITTKNETKLPISAAFRDVIPYVVPLHRGAFGKVYHTYDLKNKRNICHVLLDSEFEYIEYNGTRYPIRYVRFWDMNVCIATISFEKALIDEKTGLPTSRKTESIDVTIFYFVRDDEIYLPQHELFQLLEEQVA